MFILFLNVYLSFLFGPRGERTQKKPKSCHGSMSYRQDFRRNVAPCTAVPAQEHVSSRTSLVLRKRVTWQTHLAP